MFVEPRGSRDARPPRRYYRIVTCWLRTGTGGIIGFRTPCRAGTIPRGPICLPEVHIKATISRRPFGLPAAAAAALCLTVVMASARETKLGSVGFELPKDWKVQMDGAERLTASPLDTPDTPPLVMAEFCLVTADRPCPAADPPTGPTTGCVDPQLNTKEWPHGVVEKRWICPRVTSNAGIYTLAVGHFITPAWTLRVVYIAADKDKPPNKFLDTLAKTLRND
jgi:hypothetical protein